MRPPLAGLAIWCTRPGRAGERSCHRLHTLGARIHHAPTVTIRPVSPSAESLARLQRAASSCVVAVTSPTSVENFVDTVGVLRPDGRPWPAIAVGDRTAIRARELGLDVVGMAPRATARDLLPVVLGASGAGLVVVPGSNLRRRELLDGLHEAGREVLELAVQETVPIVGMPARLPSDPGAIDLLVAYSPSALAFVGSLSADERDTILGIPVAVMGPTTGGAARSLGFNVAVEPADPHEDHLVGMICRWAQARS